jgi:NAD(P)-dependent dehydrogenase (short-subunit alcohol dehydrogenase family)
LSNVPLSKFESLISKAMANPEQQTIFVTGASKGIGKRTCELFADRGWRVAAAARHIDDVVFDDPHHRIKSFSLDVTDQTMVRATLDRAVEKFGRIDVVVNNAGFGNAAPFEEMSDSEVRQHFETNVFGAMNVMRAVLPHMRENRSGRIINMSSICGRMTLPLFSAYCASKWALDGFSEALSFEVKGQGIKIKIIEPGVFRTDFFNHAKLKPEDRTPQPSYRNFVRRVMPKLEAWEERSPGPVQVAECIWKAATDRWPRMRYHPRGTMTILARGLVPGTLYVRTIRRLLDAW